MSIKLRKQIGRRIKLARQAAAISQLELGRKLDLTDKTISSYESGRISPPVDKLVKLASLLQQPLSYFIGEDPADQQLSISIRQIEHNMLELIDQFRELTDLVSEQVQVTRKA